MFDSSTIVFFPSTSSCSHRAFAIAFRLLSNSAIAHSTMLEVVSIPTENRSWHGE